MAEIAFVAEDATRNVPIKTIDDLCKKITNYHPHADVQIVKKAYYFSEKAHEGQFRRSGEPYIFHPLSVAGILADLRLDIDSIMTGILHDTVEDTSVTLEDIRREFGETVAALVDGVTKISQMKFKNSVEKQGENVRKMIVAMGKDIRVVLVKLADRLHNMRTLNHMPYEKQARIALETLEIYCPLAGRMGINELKIELEDLCFRYYRPDMYYQLSQKIKKTEAETDRFIDDVKKLVGKSLEKTSVKYHVYGRSKHLWSIYRKMQQRSIEYEQVYDVLAFRIIVASIPECYEVLGHIHALWKPVPGRFKDFIAMPKTNNYRSLHTTVLGPGGDRIEIQIRTEEMHLIAERGIAAHWKYKERGKISDESVGQSNWMRDLVAWHQTVRNPEEFLDTVKTEMFETEIYVFTPNGDVKELPDGATPIDFAYAIHTDLGNQCAGARINGKMVPLKHKLKNGDTVEIITSKTQTPSKDWLKFCITSKAQSKIRVFVKEEQRKRSWLLGKELIEKEFRKFGLAAVRYLKGEDFEKFMKDGGVHGLDELYIKVGYGKLEPRHLVDRLVPKAQNLEPKQEESSFMEKVLKGASQKLKRTKSLISVEGMDDMLVHFAKCCSPIPGDPIIGFISRGRGVAIHRSDCKKVFELDQLRKVDVSWNVKHAIDGMERVVKMKITCLDIPGLLKTMTESFSALGINIQSANIRTTKDKKAICLFDISVKDSSHLNQTIFEMQKIKGILSVERVSY
ncbi:MAG: bifunctional (p)ppGpp synthetase/guanosine-3',5'-bis(diphosphate) 3'-pyrophosphohydrolase [Bdellovibrionaceae bacterium]|nr:bifunctional (p)ppGpp synthetase/guanosine-3',5'-bis(diphosphate) 3'-pyrophosphohydrolase [Pseudobdellovibrionaceae bacterium]